MSFNRDSSENKKPSATSTAADGKDSKVSAAPQSSLFSPSAAREPDTDISVVSQYGYYNKVHVLKKDEKDPAIQEGVLYLKKTILKQEYAGQTIDEAAFEYQFIVPGEKVPRTGVLDSSTMQKYQIPTWHLNDQAIKSFFGNIDKAIHDAIKSQASPQPK